MAELGCARTETDCERNLADEIATSKRPRSSPTLSTPQRQEKRVPLRELVNHEVGHEVDHEEIHEEARATLRLAPKRLNIRSENDSREKWSEEEVKALAEFILFHTPGDKWPSHKQETFWTGASKFVKHRVKSSAVCRSGMSQY